MTYRIIALDLDGTLLDRQKRILPESLSALADARAAEDHLRKVLVEGGWLQ